MGKYWSKMAYYLLYTRPVPMDYDVRGLLNYKLSCCVNALLQSFSATTELLDILNKWHPSDRTDKSNVPLQLKNILEAMRGKSYPAPYKDFLNCLYRQAIQRWTEQDADEIFHIILSLSQKQIADAVLAQEISSLFEIKVETQVGCLNCKFIQRMPNSLFSLPLAICERENSLENCINSFFQLQKLVDSEKVYCDKCEKRQPSTYESKLVSLPPILCVHLKRFRNDDGLPRKLYNKVAFPETFSTGIFSAGKSEADCLSSDEHYSLYAVVVHKGTTVSGHYTAFIRPNQEKMWYYADDSCVRPSTWADVQGTYGGYRQRYGETAYLLLYRKKS
ncbi:ubl carboxyl-terminal hydrolase 18-like isoform X1 [Carassius auratus]|uniref:Ubl carboxyl-terminal hydrolase 18-like isoform X1 n=2 Tax=Carassius auratus TaxID=7957 RepID=A0A6P6JZF1_CARAU|nr:ubl carboxyl-terminal hydrolase 18-like isoform X1 [Carassius auratus]XP_026116836.1 ubl carboxyl-terminal hydrolase 18-like isoform X1 [Carassius auratus]